MAEPIPVNATMLEWARQRAHMSQEQLAKKVGTSVERVRQWEEAASTPTERQLRLIAKATRRPTAIFFMDAPPQDFDVMRVFRTSEGKPVERLTHQIAAALDDAHGRAEETADLFEIMGTDYTTRLATLKQEVADARKNAAKIAQMLRSVLGVDVEQQATWKTHGEALRQWRWRIEQRLHVVVFVFDGVESEDARGFALTSTRVNAIGLNAKDHPAARVFTLMHELAHVVLGTPSELTDEMDSDSRTEVLCNAIAAETLMPEREFLRSLQRLGDVGLTKEVDEISGLYCVSRTSVLRRMLDLGHITRDEYVRRVRRISKQHLDSDKTDARNSGGGPTFYIKRRFRLGYAFRGCVADALAGGHITLLTASRLLGAKVGQVEQLLAPSRREVA